jgi:hypothetical protein
VSALLRAFRPAPPLAPDNRYFIDASGTMSYQSPVKSPSVFNFFQPGYLPPGPLATAGLFGPEFQIIQETSVVSVSNHANSIIQNGIGTGEQNANGDSVSVRLDLEPYIALLKRTDKEPAENQNDLIESLNILLLGGQMSLGLDRGIRNALAALPAEFSDDEDRDRVRMVIYIIAASPEFAVQK